MLENILGIIGKCLLLPKRKPGTEREGGLSKPSSWWSGSGRILDSQATALLHPVEKPLLEIFKEDV